MLTVLRNGQYEPMNDEEFQMFKNNNVELAKYFEDEKALEYMPIPDVPETAPIYENWEKAAKRLLSSLMKHSGAWIFLEPVNPEKLMIPDYLEIIKHPMDFGTIKIKLHDNQYA